MDIYIIPTLHFREIKLVQYEVLVPPKTASQGIGHRKTIVAIENYSVVIFGIRT